MLKEELATVLVYYYYNNKAHKRLLFIDERSEIATVRDRRAMPCGLIPFIRSAIAQ